MLHPDSKRIRELVPALASIRRGKPPVYLDNACTTLRPEPVIEAVAEYQRRGAACHGRAYHRFGREASSTLETAREAARRFLGAASKEEIVFTRGATDGINLVASCLPMAEGDVVITTDMEHNSNLLPWQLATKRRGITHRLVTVDPRRGLDMDGLRRALRGGARLVSVFHVSNLLGLELPLKEIGREARRHGALLMVDGAQSVMTHDVPVTELGADLFAFSLHKVFGPTGIGVLYGKAEVLESLSPSIVGGNSVIDATYPESRWQEVPARLEPGVANVDGAAGARAAIELLESLGRAEIRAHVTHLNRLASERLRSMKRVRILGPDDPEERGAILTFVVDGLRAEGVARVLDEAEGIMVRHGKHCVHPWFNEQGVPDAVRASFAVYNTEEEVLALAGAMERITELVG